MKLKNNIFFILIALASSAHAISFRDYYHGNEELGIRPHEKEVNAAVATGMLNLNNIGLTDLIGFDEIPRLTSLKKLYISDNLLTELPENIFHGLNRLQRLELDNNQLIELPENIFHDLIQLNQLDLSHNQFITFPKNIFKSLKAVLWIYLNDNELITLPQNIFHGLPSLLGVHLQNNQITTLPENIFPSRLERVFLYNNPLPLTQVKEAGIGPNTVVVFKSPQEAQAEDQLFAAIRNAQNAEVRKIIDAIIAENIPTRGNYAIKISKIRDASGNNLLHAAIQSAAARLGTIAGLGVQLSEEEKKEAKEVLAEQRSKINDRYMKIIGAILSCGDECVQEMLFTPNHDGQMVIDEMFAKLGPTNPITQAILSILTPEEEAVHPRPKRTLEQSGPEEKPVETMADAEAIEKEQEEEIEGRKRQKPNQSEEQ